METDTKIIIAGVALMAGYFLYKKLANPATATPKEVYTYTFLAGNAGNHDVWSSTLNPGSTMINYDNGNGTNTTYEVTPDIYNAMNRWQRLLYSWGINPFPKMSI